MSPAGNLWPLLPTDPRRLGQWILEGRLGSGGMGTVYLARRGADAGRAALKVIHPGLAGDPSFRARFKREVRLSRLVKGAYVASVLDADPEAPIPWLATEYIPGPTLGDFVSEQGPLSEAQCVAFSAGLLEGLASIHSAGVVHRDLKPSNVLVTETGPVIIDFGIASAADATSLTGTGMTLGSAGWMSPEQVTGAPIGPPADVFAWASVTCFAATGRGPFGEGRPDALAYRVAHGDPNLAGLPSMLLPLVERAFTRTPTQRPSLDELREAVSTRVGNDTTAVAASWTAPTVVIEQTAPTPGPPTRRFTWRTVAFVSAVVAVLAASIGVYFAADKSGSTAGERAADRSDATTAGEPTTTSTTSTTTESAVTSSPSTTLAGAVDVDMASIAELLPPFHEELGHLVVTRPGGATAVLSVTAPRQPEPRPLALTLIEWDRDRYRTADSLEWDCGFLEDLEFDEDDAIFIGCTGGATSHSLTAVIPEPLEIATLPSPSFDEPAPAAWEHLGWERHQRADAPDDLTIYAERCEPDCVNSKRDAYELIWSDTWNLWDLVSCTREGEPTYHFDQPINGSVSELGIGTFHTCPAR